MRVAQSKCVISCLFAVYATQLMSCKANTMWVANKCRGLFTCNGVKETAPYVCRFCPRCCSLPAFAPEPL
eukprot:3103072-Amphidinium_carterae.1